MEKPRNPGQSASRAKVELLNLHKGEISYYLFIRNLKFLKGLRHICPDPRIMGSDILEATVKECHIKHVEKSNQLRLGNLDALSIIIRKLKFPFLTKIEYFDKHTNLIAGQKLEKLLQVIPPKTMAQLTNLEIEFPFESELPQEPVVSAPDLKKVKKNTLLYELNLLPKPILSSLFALMTNTGIKRVRTLCDNQRDEGCFEDLRRRVEQMTSGEIPTNQKTHWEPQHCRNHQNCPDCRALCAMMTIWRHPSNLNIGKHIARCVWHGSIFAELAMRHFLIMTLGPTCALAQVVNDPESPHRDLLIQLLTEKIVQETPEEKKLREQQDAADREIELAEFRNHDDVEIRLNAAECAFQKFIYELGWDPRKYGI